MTNLQSSSSQIIFERFFETYHSALPPAPIALFIIFILRLLLHHKFLVPAPDGFDPRDPVLPRSHTVLTITIERRHDTDEARRTHMDTDGTVGTHPCCEQLP